MSEQNKIMPDYKIETLIGKTPNQLAQIKILLVDSFSKMGEEKIILLENRALYYETYRTTVKSDTALKRKWETTKDGLDYMKVRERMRYIELQLAAINSSLYTANRESKNQF